MKQLIIASTLVFLLYVFAPPLHPFVLEYLALGPGLLHGMVWQLVTSLFVHLDPLSFFFNVIGLWFIGAQMEGILGRRRFLTLFVGAAVAGGLAGVVVGVALGQGTVTSGMGLGVLSLFVAFGVHYGRTQVRVMGGLDVEARVLAAVMVLFALVVEAAHGAVQAMAGTLTATVVAFFLSGGRRQHLRGMLSRKRKGKPSTRFVVIDGGPRKRTSSGETDDRYLN